MPRRIRWYVIAVFLVTVGLCFASSPQTPAPVPPDVNLEPPAPELPDEVKSLVGKWAGQWNSRWDTVLYVEKVDKDSARVVLSWGEYTTSHGTCHCGPNWVRVQSAKVKYSGGKATLAFYTPTLRPRWLKESHTITGSYEETYHPHDMSSGRYTYSFVLKTREPKTMKGDFFSSRNSQLRIKMQKIE
jgi:hypothetical protein